MAFLEAYGALAATTQLTEQLLRCGRAAHDAPSGISEHISSLRHLTVVLEEIKSNPAAQSSQGAELLKSLQTKIEELSADLNKVLIDAEHSTATAITKRLRAAWEEKNFYSRLDQIEREKSTLALYLAPINAQVHGERVRELASEIHQIRRGLEASSLIDENEQWRNQALAELYVTKPVDTRASLIRIKGTRSAGSCTWVTKSHEYLAWRSPESQSPLLWVCGGPGKGKTMLSIFLTKEMEKDIEPSNLIYFFCDHNDLQRASASGILQALILQLLSATPSLVQYLLPEFKIQRSQLFDEASFDTLWRVFETIVNHNNAKSIYCLLDAIDELQPTSLELLLEKLRHPPPKLKLIVLSRPFPSCIKEALQDYTTISLDPEHDEEVNKDVSNYVVEKVDELSRFKGYPPALKEHVLQTLQRRAQGTFLWVGFAVNILKKARLSETESCLDELPSGLHDLYDRILLGIEQKHASIVASMLTWVTLALNPLRLEGLGTALHFQPGSYITLKDLVTEKIQLCGGLLVIDGDHVMLVHQSAADYLRRPKSSQPPSLACYHVDEDMGNCDLARRCLEYLETEAPSLGPILFSKYRREYEMQEPYRSEERARGTYPWFSDYAGAQWLHHARASPSFARRHKDLFRRVFRDYFLDRDSTVRSWVGWWWWWHSKGGGMYNVGDLRGAEFVLALELSLSTLAKELWPDCGLTEKPPEYGVLGLNVALRSRNEEMVQFLLDRRIDVNARPRGNLFWSDEKEFPRMDKPTTPLLVAIKYRDVKMIQILLRAGASVDMPGADGETPLHAAVSWKCNSDVVFILIALLTKERSTTDDQGRTPLHLECNCLVNWRHLFRVYLLLKLGADPNAVDGRGDTPLNVLCWQGSGNASFAISLAIIKLFLSKGADIETQNHQGNTPLHHAAEWGDLGLTQALIWCDAKLETANSLERTPLHRAAANARGDVVKYLLARGANPNALDNEGHTPRALAEHDLKIAERYPRTESRIREYSQIVEALKAAEQSPRTEYIMNMAGDQCQVLVDRLQAVTPEKWESHISPQAQLLEDQVRRLFQMVEDQVRRGFGLAETAVRLLLAAPFLVAPEPSKLIKWIDIQVRGMVERMDPELSELVKDIDDMARKLIGGQEQSNKNSSR